MVYYGLFSNTTQDKLENSIQSDHATIDHAITHNDKDILDDLMGFNHRDTNTDIMNTALPKDIRKLYFAHYVLK